jgi:hypothetical protein
MLSGNAMSGQDGSELPDSRLDCRGVVLGLPKGRWMESGIVRQRVQVERPIFVMLELAWIDARTLLENHHLKAVRRQFLGQHPAGGSRSPQSGSPRHSWFWISPWWTLFVLFLFGQEFRVVVAERMREHAGILEANVFPTHLAAISMSRRISEESNDGVLTHAGKEFGLFQFLEHRNLLRGA